MPRYAVLQSHPPDNCPLTNRAVREFAMSKLPHMDEIAARHGVKVVLNDHLEGRTYIVGDDYTIADISAWGWLDRASRVLKGAEDPLGPYPNLKRLFQTVDARPAVARARAVGKNHTFKTVNDDETKRSLFPSNYPPASAQGV